MTTGVRMKNNFKEMGLNHTCLDGHKMDLQWHGENLLGYPGGFFQEEIEQQNRGEKVTKPG